MSTSESRIWRASPEANTYWEVSSVNLPSGRRAVVVLRDGWYVAEWLSSGGGWRQSRRPRMGEVIPAEVMELVRDSGVREVRRVV